MTELQFLIDLLLNHKLPPATKKLLAARIGEVEGRYQPQAPQPWVGNARANPSAQAPSTQKILDQMAMEVNPPENAVATTPAAAAALQARADAIRLATQSQPLRGKPEPGRTSPRKF